MHVGNINVRRETVPRREEQRRHRQNRERGATGSATQLSPSALFPDVPVLVLRAQQEAQFQGD